VKLLILGASARAAVWSAARAGFEPLAVDLFADRDLRTLTSDCRRVEPGDYPEGLLAAAESLPDCPWIYTGALENRPDLIERIAAKRTLWGNGAATVRAARGPVLLADALKSAGLCTPEVRLEHELLPRDGSWLRKPFASCAGHGVIPFTAPCTKRTAWYYQERIDGPSFSAIFVGRSGGAVLRGVTRQLIGRESAPFAYRGNIAPWPVSTHVLERLAAVGQVLACSFGLVGLFGVDWVLKDDEPWPVELNPRYTAAVDALELALGSSLLAEHCAACAGIPSDDVAKPPTRVRRFVGKEIVFAPSAGVFVDSELTPLSSTINLDAVPEIADIPARGTRFEAGDPVLTVYSEGASHEECSSALMLRLDRWRRQLLKRSEV
jgi:predicted ATP-grasp superfamily ATP-dependent carboligase